MMFQKTIGNRFVLVWGLIIFKYFDFFCKTLEHNQIWRFIHFRTQKKTSSVMFKPAGFLKFSILSQKIFTSTIFGH